LKLPPSPSDNPRKLAVQILNRVDEEQAFAEPLLDATLSAGRPEKEADRGLLTFLVYGTLRTRGLLDFLIDSFYRGKPDTLETGIRNILRVALYQSRFAGKIPEYAAVDEAVNTTKQLFPGREKLVNAILRNALRGMADITVPPFDTDPAVHISVVHSHPRWLVEQWIGNFGIEETLALCRADNEIPPISLRVNRLKTTREDMLERLARSGHDVKPAVYSPEGIILAKPPASLREMPEVASGFLYVQDEASQLVSRLLAPRRGERVLDLCAGSGGKTTHLAALMENEGEIVAADIQAGKLTALESTAKRWGITTVKTAVVDAAIASNMAALGSFDRVLVDAPCSGLGTLRRNPEIRWHLTGRKLGEFAPLQKRILANASACVKKEGLLLYSTCSVMPEENEDVVAAFLEGHPDFAPARPAADFPAEVLAPKGFLRTVPHRHGTDGFFGALLRRR
jgi:16S rRNA (cytosine967-C5)-methyltransferase